MWNEDITKISIKEYIEGLGIPTRVEGSRTFCSSPFSSDRNWSFCIYPTNTYFDWSTGHGGNIINLVSRLNNCSLAEAAKTLKKEVKDEKYKPNYTKRWEEPEQRGLSKPFDYETYVNTNPEECEEIKKYAASRGITEGYFCGVFFNRIRKTYASRRGQREIDGWELERTPALGFVHVDKNLQPCGVKLRRIDNKEPRFAARGRLGMYLRPAIADAVGIPKLYLVEGEANANVLWTFLRGTSNVLSAGGVSSVLKWEDLPPSLRGLSMKLILDYDGSEELYQERLKLYKELKSEPIKLILPKGEDINSLYCRGEMWKIENLLL